MDQLKTGKISADSLIKWFHTSKSTYARNKELYLEILRQYARYHIVKNGRGDCIYIDEVYEAEYIDEKGPPVRQRVHELLYENWQKDGLDTCMHIAEKNYPILQSEGYKIKETTNYNYTCEERTALWGSPIYLTAGEKGHCHYEFCKRDDNGNYVPFNAQEQKIKEELIRKYFGNLDEWVLGISEDLNRGRITREEAGLALENLDSHGDYVAWKTELEARIGATVHKATRIYDYTRNEEVSAF